jgi:hypothetical protein
MSIAAATPVTGARWRRIRPAVVTAGVLGAATAALQLRDPHQHGSWGFCPLKAATGWDCPFCGGLRSVNDLGHGDLGAAWHSNALFVSSIPLLAGLWILWLSRSWTGARMGAPSETTIRILIVVAIAFAILRNTPWGSSFYAS